MYSPACPLRFQQYSELLTSEERQGRPASLNISEQRLKQSESESWEGDAKISSGVEPHRQQTLLESAHDVGGIGVFIFLFAKVCTRIESRLVQQRRLYANKGHPAMVLLENAFGLSVHHLLLVIQLV